LHFYEATAWQPLPHKNLTMGCSSKFLRIAGFPLQLEEAAGCFSTNRRMLAQKGNQQTPQKKRRDD
jgi:hypothetical protein